MISELLHFLYPRVCPACHNELLPTETLLCLYCLNRIPFTYSHLTDENTIAKKFRGRSYVQFAGAMTYFLRGGIMQSLIHELKYRNAPNIGTILGKMYGMQIRDIPLLLDVDHIVPVPMHKRKLRIRGYNQAEYIAKGLSAAMKKPVNTKIVVKANHSGSQTLRDLYGRWKNTKEVFQISQNFQDLTGKHILLVDDVITTGATLCACADLLLELEDIKVSIAAIAFTKK